jgi:hypothetical protein
MAELDGTNRNEAGQAALVRLMPGAGEATAQDITTSKEFTCSPGDYWTITVTETSFLATHATSATATASSTPLAAGAHDFCVPTGVGKFAIFSATTGAKGAAWKS